MKRDSVYIQHMLEQIEKIQKHCDNVDVLDFKTNSMLQDALFRELEIIGEASKKVSEQTKEKYSVIPWRVIAGLRDKLVHDYFSVDIYAIWKTIHDDIPALSDELTKIKNDHTIP